MKKVFLSGPVSGLDYDQVVKNFNAAEQLMLNKGYQVMNPISFVPSGTDWNKAMRRCIVALSKCDTIYLLKEFYLSEGCSLELEIANALDFEKIFEEDEIDES